MVPIRPLIHEKEYQWSLANQIMAEQVCLPEKYAGELLLQFLGIELFLSAVGIWI